MDLNFWQEQQAWHPLPVVALNTNGRVFNIQKPSWIIVGFYGDELKYMASAGISNFETLRMATYENARILNMQDRIGTIEKGKWADIIAIEGDPLVDLDSMNNVRMVMKGGAFIKSEGIAV